MMTIMRASYLILEEQRENVEAVLFSLQGKGGLLFACVSFWRFGKSFSQTSQFSRAGRQAEHTYFVFMVTLSVLRIVVSQPAPQGTASLFQFVFLIAFLSDHKNSMCAKFGK